MEWIKIPEDPTSPWADPPYKLRREHTFEEYEEWNYAHISWMHDMQRALWVLDRYNLHVQVEDHVHMARKTLSIAVKVELREGVGLPLSEEEPIDISQYTHVRVTLTDTKIRWLSEKFKKTQGYSKRISLSEAQRLEEKYGFKWRFDTDHWDVKYRTQENPFLWLDTFKVH